MKSEVTRLRQNEANAHNDDNYNNKHRVRVKKKNFNNSEW